VEGEHEAFLPELEVSASLPLEPFLNRLPLVPAQWPNRDNLETAAAEMMTDYRFTRVAGNGALLSSGTTRRYRFPYMSSAPFAAWTDWDDVVAFGFWSVDWFSAFVPVYSSTVQMDGGDEESPSLHDTLEIEIPSSMTEDDGLGGVNAGARFAILNSFHGLDSAGEYVLKRNAGSSAKLFFIPHASMASTVASAELIVSTSSEALISFDSEAGDALSTIHLKRLTIEATRGNGMISTSSDNAEIAELKFLNIGLKGVEMSGSNIRVSNTEMSWIGGKAISLSGGVVSTLTPSGIIVEGVTISHSPRRSLHYGECFDFGGVGIRATANTIYASSTAVVELTGNDHVLEFNEIHHVALDAFDTGAIHWAAFNPASTGFIIRHNFIHHVGYKEGSPCSASTSCLLAAIYADDGSYGFHAEGNVFWMPQPSRSAAGMGSAEWFADEVQVIGVFANGGSRNTVVNNVMIDVNHVFASSGGFLTSGGYGAEPPVASDSEFWDGMRSISWQAPPFSTAYPWLANLVDSYPDDCATNNKCALAPWGDTVSANVGIDVDRAYYWFGDVSKSADVEDGEPPYFDFPTDFNMQGLSTNIDRVSTQCTNTAAGTINTDNELTNAIWDAGTCTLAVTPSTSGLVAHVTMPASGTKRVTVTGIAGGATSSPTVVPIASTASPTAAPTASPTSTGDTNSPSVSPTSTPMATGGGDTVCNVQLCMAL
jgi:hypothetical protein